MDIWGSLSKRQAHTPGPSLWNLSVFLLRSTLVESKLLSVSLLMTPVSVSTLFLCATILAYFVLWIPSRIYCQVPLCSPCLIVFGPSGDKMSSKIFLWPINLSPHWTHHWATICLVVTSTSLLPIWVIGPEWLSLHPIWSHD